MNEEYNRLARAAQRSLSGAIAYAEFEGFVLVPLKERTMVERNPFDRSRDNVDSEIRALEAKIKEMKAADPKADVADLQAQVDALKQGSVDYDQGDSDG